MNTTAELGQLVIPPQRSMGFAGRQPTVPQVFTFEPIRENKRRNRRKRRFIKVLYPPHQVRRTLPTQKDLAKRLLLFLLTVVVVQIYTATEDDLNLAAPGATGVQEAPAASGESSAPAAPSLSVVLSAEAESNCSRSLPGGDALLKSFLACRM